MKRPSRDQLLERIRRRVALPAGRRKTSAQPTSLPPPATAAEITKAQFQLGFDLPVPLKQLYTTIANGGFGPGEGFLGVPSRKAPARPNLVTLYRTYSRRPGFPWPTRLLPVTFDGADVSFCVDCDHSKHRVISFDGALADLEESDISQPRRSWPYPAHPAPACFRTRARSFDEFLEMWLADETQLYRWL